MFTPIIAFLALLVSLVVLVIQYQNQMERRHAEIVQLRLQIMTMLSSMAQRVQSQLFNGEIVRIELRRLPDTSVKWATIEKLPRMLAKIVEIEKGIDNTKAVIEKIDTQRSNRSEVLLLLQSTSGNLQRMINTAEEAEKSMLLLLKSVRNEQQY